MSDPTALWQLLANISTVVSGVVVVAAAITAVWQLRESARARMLSAMLSVYDNISEPSARQDRKLVYERDLSLAPADWSPELYAAAERTVIMFVRLSALVKHQLIPRGVFLRTHANLVIRVADELEQFVQYRRDITGTTFARDFDWLANVARHWRLTRPDRSAALIVYSAAGTELRRVNSLPRRRTRQPIMRLQQWLASVRYPDRLDQLQSRLPPFSAGHPVKERIDPAPSSPTLPGP